MKAAILSIRVAYDERKTSAGKVAAELTSYIRYVHEVEGEGGKYDGLSRFDELAVASDGHDPAEFFTD